MRSEDKVVGEIIVILVREKLFAKHASEPIIKLVGFRKDEIRAAMRTLTEDQDIRDQKVVIKIGSHDPWPDDPSDWFLDADKDETQVTIRNNTSATAVVLFEVEAPPEGQSFRDADCIQDGTVLKPGSDEGGGESRRKTIARLAWESATGVNERTLPADFVLLLEKVFHTVEGESEQLSLRSWVEFVVRCAVRVAKSGRAIARDQVQDCVVAELPWLRLFHDELLYSDNGEQQTKRLVRNVRMAGMSSPAGKDVDEDQIELKIEATEFRGDNNAPLAAAEQDKWRGHCLAVLRERNPEQYRAVPLQIWEQIFAKEKETREGLGSRIAKHLQATAPDRCAEYADLEVHTGLDDQEPNAAKLLLDADASEPDAIPLCDLLRKPLRKAVEKLANPRSPTVPEPLAALLQHLYDCLKDSELNFESLELRDEEGRQETGAYTLALFRFLYAKTLTEICAGTEDEHQIPLRVDDRLIKGPVDFVTHHRELHPETDVPEDSDHDQLDAEVEIAWEDLRLQLVGQPGNQVLRRFTWSPSDLRGPAGLAAFSRMVSEAGRIGRVTDSGSDLESWCERMKDPRNALEGDFPASLNSGPVDAWKEIRNEAFLAWRTAGLSCDEISNFVDDWAGILGRALEECVPKQEQHEELEAFVEMETFRPSANRLVLLATHPIRLRWIASYLRSLRDHIRHLLSGQFRLNPEAEDLFFDRLADYSPHRQPPVMSPGHQDLSVATREFGWHEEYDPIVQKDAPSDHWVSSIDGESISAMTGVVKRYLEAHPHKIDGLSILFISRDGDAKHIERLVKEIRSGEASEMVLTVHVVAPTASHEDIVKKLEGLSNQERSHLELLPRLRTILHPISVIASAEVARDLDLEDEVDLVMVPNLFGLETTVQPAIQSRRPGSFDPLLDDPTCDTSGHEGSGRKNVTRDFIPFRGDTLLEGWSSLQVWRKSWKQLDEGETDKVNFFSLQVLFTKGADLFGRLHRWGHWVVTLDPYVGRDQVEASAGRPEVITVQPKVGKNGRYTMVVSSNSGRRFIEDRLSKQLRGVLCEVAEADIGELAKSLYESSRDFAPGVVLRALGLGRTTQEILGLIVSRNLVEARRPIDKKTADFQAWLSLDELPHWFGGANRQRADMLRIIGTRRSGKLALRFEIVEAKYREKEDLGKGEEQLRRTKDVLGPAFSHVIDEEEVPYADSAIWRRELLAAIAQCAARSPEKGLSGGLWVRSAEGSSAHDAGGLPEEIKQDILDSSKVDVEIETILCTVAAQGQAVEQEVTKSPNGEHVWIRVGAKGLQRVLLDMGGLAAESTGDASHGVSAAGTSDSADHSLSDERIPKIAPECVPDTPPDVRLTEDDQADQADPDPAQKIRGIGREGLDKRFQDVINLFAEFKIPVSAPENYSPMEGPAFYEVRLVPGRGVPSERLTSQCKGLKLRLKLEEKLNIRTFIDRGTVVFQIPKEDNERYYVSTTELWSRANHPESSRNSLRTPVGEDAKGNPVVIDFSDTDSPHLLIGGTTGSGKSVALESILEGLCAAHPAARLRLRLIDPKGTELIGFEEREHLEGEIGCDADDAVELLEAEVGEMERRYRAFKDLKKQKGIRVHKLVEFNEHVEADDILPWRVIVLDEYADLTTAKEDRQRIEPLVQRIAQKGRAAGIHLIVATQKPSAEILSTAIRSNLPAQLALRVKTATDSRIVIDETGAETLAGRGDAFLKTQKGLVRVQTACHPSGQGSADS
ncbi:FtsK/SpoIIIE domain-containing protein [bacterium]|nr:FtsK/SpoIIIE domain-containing protein [bacterium]